jgi:tetratricopeptide (TPR) repeat protein
MISRKKSCGIAPESGSQNLPREEAKKLGAAESPYVPESTGVAENSMGLYVPLCKFNRDGKFDQGTALLYEEYDRNRSNSKLQLNLCVGYGATRRYDEAIDCYESVLKVLPSTDEAAQRELQRQEAQVYYLKGDHEEAIKRYIDLVADGDSASRLGLGEAYDAHGKFDDESTSTTDSSPETTHRESWQLPISGKA